MNEEYRQITAHSSLPFKDRSGMKTQRLRDPLHDLIVFDKDDVIDQTAWALINAREFQRLRRIRQLGFSEIVYPGATHTRFAHSVGVYHTARLLLAIAKRQLANFDIPQQQITLLAALLHDLGHGPFSHAFEEVQKARGLRKKHEEWTIEIITSPVCEVHAILAEASGLLGIQNLPERVADIIRQETPRHIYDAIVSSQFDADRLDYIRRDRLMSGAQAGAIDFQWLLDCLEIDEDIGLEESDEDASVRTTGFCLSHKGLHPMETFLLGRYHLYNQVYLHKTTRGMERMFAHLLFLAARHIAAGNGNIIGLDEHSSLARFFTAPSLENYLALDDVTVWSEVGRMTTIDNPLRDLAKKLWDRKLFKNIDISSQAGNADERITRFIRRFSERFPVGNDGGLLIDIATVSAYGIVRFDGERIHKRIMVRRAPGVTPEEISDMSDVMRTLRERRSVRVYAPDGATIQAASELLEALR